MSTLVPVWLLLVNVGLILLLAAVVVYVCRGAYQRAIESATQDRKDLHKLLKSAQDRIHAADLSGYMAIKDRENQPRLQSFSRTDEEEAAIEEARMGLNGGSY